MTDRDTRPRILATTPVFFVGDISSTMHWYRETVGFEARPWPPSPPHHFCILTRDDVRIMLQRLKGHEKPDVYDQREGGGWNAYLSVTGVRDLYDAVIQQGHVRVLEPLCAQEHDATEFVIQDPNGYVLVFGESAQSA
jgi:predicted enzyme related to lactoylglutathione lyase